MNASHDNTALASRTDDELMAMIRDGDADASLCASERRHGREMRRVAQSILRDPGLASDVANEAIEKVWLKRDRYQVGTNFRAWLLGVTRNHALTILRGMRRATRIGASVSGNHESDDGDALEQVAHTHDTAVDARELEAALAAAVAELSPRYGPVFRICVQEQRPYTEASRQLSLPKGTVAIRIRRARQQVFGAMAPHLEPAQVHALARHYAPCA
jgi:RNA polymerase sigma-70 factor (ECF subfamily)